MGKVWRLILGRYALFLNNQPTTGCTFFRYSVKMALCIQTMSWKELRDGR